VGHEETAVATAVYQSGGAGRRTPQPGL